MKGELAKIKQAQEQQQSNTQTTASEIEKKITDNNMAAFQELFELTQRRFLKNLYELSDKHMTSMSRYPNLFCVDLKKEVAAAAAEEAEGGEKGGQKESHTYSLCIRAMCEFEEGWHAVQSNVAITKLSIANHLESDYNNNDDNDNNNNNEEQSNKSNRVADISDVISQVPPIFCSYLYRVVNIMSCGGQAASELALFATPAGRKLIEALESKASAQADVSLVQSYTALRQYFVKQWEEQQSTSNSQADMGVGKYELKSGKVLFLCDKHAELTSARRIENSNSVNINENAKSEINVTTMLQDIERKTFASNRDT